MLPSDVICLLPGIDACACEALVNSTCEIDSCPFEGSSRVLPDLPNCPEMPIQLQPIYSIPDTPISTTHDVEPVVSCTGYMEGFSCESGQWVSNHSISSPSVTVPSELGIVTINGSFDVPGTLTFVGTGTTVVAKGCAKIGEIELVLSETPENPSKVPLVLMEQNDGCPTSLADIPLELKTPNSCKRTSADRNSSTRSSLSVIFVVSSSRCNTKWIILGSVLGGVLIIAVVVIGIISIRKYKLDTRITSRRSTIK